MFDSAAHVRISQSVNVYKSLAILVRLVTSVPSDVTLLHNLVAATLLPVLKC